MKQKSLAAYLFFLLLIFSTACSDNWEIDITSQGSTVQTFSSEQIDFYLDQSTGSISEIPLGQVLYDSGFSIVDTITLKLNDGSTSAFDWELVAATATISASGTVTISNTDYTPTSIEVNPSSLATKIEWSIMDIAPTMAHALDIPNPPESVGVKRIEGSADYGLMILLDGLQFEKLMQLIETEKLSFFQQHQDEIQKGLTVYPSISTSASAALLTSAPPQVNGVFGYGYRSTETVTLFDLATQAGLVVKAVEGDSLAFNLRNAETMLSGDRDGDGFSDDNVLENSLDVIRSGMPELMYIHFHNIDDLGHSFGPNSAEYVEAIIRVDGYLAEIYETLPNNTLIAIFADHGMHVTEEGGNHGTLVADDMIIPILLIQK
ncbi:MAG: alkaline phosphatase family protein [Brevefilum sp.]